MDSGLRHEPKRWSSYFGRGLVGGFVAALVMGVFAMVAGATYLGSGFFTPLHHIGSVFIGPEAMEASMGQAQAGNLFHLDPLPALTGLGVHMVVGGVFGLIFGGLVGALRLRGVAAALVGIIYGLAVMGLMVFLALPWVAEALGGGEAIANMGEMVGMGTFALEHAIFGLVLGLWPIYRPSSTVVTTERAGIGG